MKKEKCCGCIIFDEDKVLLIKQNNGVCGFPKGHVENDETEVETAIREVKEETNLDVIIDESKRYQIQYTTDTGIDKEVVFFVAHKKNNDIIKQECEIEEIKWLNFDDALDFISFDNSKDLFKKVLKDLNLN